jgi:hypothetical protein
MKRIFYISPIVLVLMFALYIFVAWKWNYSTGERAGWVQKLSKKGWVCKTWEGEMAMVAQPGTIPEKFYFTIHNDKIASEVNEGVGKRVSLVYDEHVGLPTSCFGETRYFVKGVKDLSSPPEEATTKE